MIKLPLSSIGIALIGALAVAACVGDDPSGSTPETGAQGALGGPCFANGTCSAGLSCNLVEGTAKCAPSSEASSGDASVDAPGSDGTTSTTDSSTSGPLVCKFQTTPFPCGGQQSPVACYGATQSCTLTGCSALSWACNSANQCGTACCVPTMAATLNTGPTCTEGTMLITAGATSGAACAPGIACTGGDTQLCQSNANCPPGQRCTPVKIIGAGAALNGTIVAACVP